MKAYVIARIRVRDLEKYRANYVPASTASIAKFGGRFLVRGGRTLTLEGAEVTERIAVVEWPSVARAQEWYASEDYTRARKMREGIADGQLCVVEGVAPVVDQALAPGTRNVSA